MVKFKRVWLPYEVKSETVRNLLWEEEHYSPSDGEKTKSTDAKIEKLLNQGWKIVSTTPLIKSHNVLNRKNGYINYTYTSGIEVFMIKE